jgi:tRNA(Arg) A34 adenosine deaminase TadA
MCLGAIDSARIDRVFYGFGLRDAAGFGFDDHFRYEQLARPAEQRAIPEIPLLRADAGEIPEAFAADSGRLRDRDRRSARTAGCPGGPSCSRRSA